MFDNISFLVRELCAIRRLSYLIAENHSRKMSLSNRERASVSNLHYSYRMHECELAMNAVWVHQVRRNT